LTVSKKTPSRSLALIFGGNIVLVRKGGQKQNMRGVQGGVVEPGQTEKRDEEEIVSRINEIFLSIILRERRIWMF
jgi:hypothetical protein